MGKLARTPQGFLNYKFWRKRKGPGLLVPALLDALRLALELAHPLTRDLQLVPEFGQRGGLVIVEAIPTYQHVACPFGEALYGFLKVLGLHIADHLARSVRGPLILHEISELRRGSIVGSYRLVEAGGVRHRLHSEPNLVHCPPETFGDLSLARLSLQLG